MTAPRPSNEQTTDAWVAVRRVVRAVAVALFGAGVEIDREIEGFTVISTVRDVEPVAGVRAAVFTQRHAARLVREYAEHARGAGVSWADLVDPLGLADAAEREGVPAGQAAWSLVAQGLHPGEVPSTRQLYAPGSVRWTCTACGQRVTDRGPFGGHPDDIEEGHAGDCVRHRADLAAWQRGREDQS